jgi:hypothetical protein
MQTIPWWSICAKSAAPNPQALAAKREVRSRPHLEAYRCSFDRDEEREHFLLANRRLAMLFASIQRVVRQGYSTVAAMELLRLSEQPLVLWQEHR